MLGERIGVLMAAGGASWEVQALQVLAAPSSAAVLLKRCVDLPDLLATSTTGQARVAVASSGLPGLDADSVGHLRQAGVGLVLVAEPGAVVELGRLAGVCEVVAPGALDALADAVVAAAEQAALGDVVDVLPPAGPLRASAPAAGAAAGAEKPGDADAGRGRVLAVWGPTGAPGRTTVAVGVAAELAQRGRDVLLVDADGYGGAVAQHLGVLDEASGLLSAARLANAGRLDLTRLASVARTVAPGFRVLTGLPRADRWPEVRGVAFDALMEAGRCLSSHVVLDLGFSLEQADQAFGSGAPQRNLMTLAGLDHADEVVVVGSADPVGLARLARALVELPETVGVPATRVVVNKVRPSLGWGEKEVRAMVEGFVTPLSLHFLPHDSVAADRALVAGKPLVEVGESPLRRAVARVADALAPPRLAAGTGRARGARLRRRRAGRAR